MKIPKIWDKEINRLQKVFLETKKLVDKYVPKDKYILFVDMAITGMMKNKKIEELPKKLVQKIYEMETGTKEINKENFQVNNIRHCLGMHSGDPRFKYIKAYEKNKKVNMKNCVGVVLSGSEANIKDEKNKKYLRMTQRAEIIIEEAKKRKIPVMGICYGGQLISHTMGAKIDWILNSKKERERATGVQKINKVTKNKLFDDIPMVFYGAENHEQEIVRKSLPQNAELIALGVGGTVEGVFYKEHNMLALQFHPEVSASRLAITNYLLGKKIFKSKEIFNGEINKTKKEVFGVFLQMVKNYKI